MPAGWASLAVVIRDTISEFQAPSACFIRGLVFIRSGIHAHRPVVVRGVQERARLLLFASVVHARVCNLVLVEVEAAPAKHVVVVGVEPLAVEVTHRAWHFLVARHVRVLPLERRIYCVNARLILLPVLLIVPEVGASAPVGFVQVLVAAFAAPLLVQGVTPIVDAHNVIEGHEAGLLVVVGAITSARRCTHAPASRLSRLAIYCVILKTSSGAWARDAVPNGIWIMCRPFGKREVVSNQVVAADDEAELFPSVFVAISWARAHSRIEGIPDTEVHAPLTERLSGAVLDLVSQNPRDLEPARAVASDLAVQVPHDASKTRHIDVGRRVGNLRLCAVHVKLVQLCPARL
mmetsp:Transcript_33393/g.92225  ORF Transcript_33393/g.92225 Transcript_33393/m.92225 type:complete len:348 (-) Transcript_33393:609-1652(-)